jgi:hypothetical protein
MWRLMRRYVHPRRVWLVPVRLDDAVPRGKPAKDYGFHATPTQHREAEVEGGRLGMALWRWTRRSIGLHETRPCRSYELPLVGESGPTRTQVHALASIEAPLPATPLFRLRTEGGSVRGEQRRGGYKLPPRALIDISCYGNLSYTHSPPPHC